MQMFQAGGDVTVTFDLSDENGVAIAPEDVTAAAWRLLDDLENVVVNDTTISGPFTGTSISVTVPAANNNLIPNPAPNVYNGSVYTNTVQARTVELTITTDAGPVYKRAVYGIGLRQRLQILVNSFQTLTQAELEAQLIGPLEAWNAATEDQKINAMAEAYRRLTRIGYFVRWPRDPDAQNTISWWNTRNTTIPARFWQFMKMDRYLTYYPEDFRAALRKAQVCEANVVLEGDAALAARDSGIVMEQIGESKVEYQRIKPLSYGIHKKSLQYIEGYVNFRATLTRS